MMKKIDWTLQELRIKLNGKTLRKTLKNLMYLYHNYYKHKGKDMWNCTNHNFTLTKQIIDVMNECDLEPLKVAESIFYDNQSGIQAKIVLALGNSMSPTINPTDIIMIVPKEPNINDIVPVDNKVHRVIKIEKIEENYFITTKGDDNKEKDDDIINIELCNGIVKKIIKREEQPELYDTLHSLITKK